MKILVTGSKGFVGKNLIAELRNRGYGDVFQYTSGKKDFIWKQEIDALTKEYQKKLIGR